MDVDKIANLVIFLVEGGASFSVYLQEEEYEVEFVPKYKGNQNESADVFT